MQLNQLEILLCDADIKFSTNIRYGERISLLYDFLFGYIKLIEVRSFYYANYLQKKF